MKDSKQQYRRQGRDEGVGQSSSVSRAGASSMAAAMAAAAAAAADTARALEAAHSQPQSLLNSPKSDPVHSIQTPSSSRTSSQDLPPPGPEQDDDDELPSLITPRTPRGPLPAIVMNVQGINGSGFVCVATRRVTHRWPDPVERHRVS